MPRGNFLDHFLGGQTPYHHTVDMVSAWIWNVNRRQAEIQYKSRCWHQGIRRGWVGPGLRSWYRLLRIDDEDEEGMIAICNKVKERRSGFASLFPTFAHELRHVVVEFGASRALPLQYPAARVFGGAIGGDFVRNGSVFPRGDGLELGGGDSLVLTPEGDREVVVGCGHVFVSFVALCVRSYELRIF